MKKHLAKTLLLLLTVGSFFFQSACTATDDLQTFLQRFRQSGTRPAIGTVLTEADLINKLTDAIRPESDPQVIFDQIPETQRKNVNRDQFQQYIQLLRCGIPGDVLAFSHINPAESDDVRTMVRDRRPEFPEMADRLQGYWIYYQRTSQQVDQFALYIHKSKEGRAYLAADWIEQTLALANYADLYMSAVDGANISALSVLLEPFVPTKAVREAKAAKVIAYYAQNKTLRLRDFQLAHARADSIVYLEDEAPEQDSFAASGRLLEVFATPSGHNKINNIIPDELSAADVKIFFDGEPFHDFIDPEQQKPIQVRSAQIDAVLGEPRQHDNSNCLTNSDNVSQMQLMYDQAELRIIGECYRHHRWAGRIIGIRIAGPAIGLASGLQPGLKIAEVLQIYPFADETDYKVFGQTPWGEMTLVMSTDGEVLTEIALGWKSR
ncbi:MAG: hypothetical protein ACOX1U_07850 [Saccharofermentanales bacterium]|nr:hypothetical protein [Clostridiaceae bacterium]